MGGFVLFILARYLVLPLDPRLRALLSKTIFGHHELATFNPQILESDFALTPNL